MRDGQRHLDANEVAQAPAVEVRETTLAFDLQRRREVDRKTGIDERALARDAGHLLVAGEREAGLGVGVEWVT